MPKELAAEYYQAETRFQFYVSRVGSVAARVSQPELARRVIETFSQLAATDIGAEELGNIYRRARENVFLPHDKSIDLKL